MDEKHNWHAESDVMLLWLIACIPMGMAVAAAIIIFIAYLPS